MTRPARRAIATALAAALVACALAACSATAAPPPRRTTPNAVELAAVQFALGTERPTLPNADTGWVQLWTVDQYPGRMETCAGDRSHGQMTLDPATTRQSVLGIGAEATGSIVWQIVGSGTHPTSAEAHQIIDYCRSVTPVDERVTRLPVSATDALYSYDLTVLRPCLISNGFDVGPIPSRARFRELVGAGTPWSPYDRVVVATRLDWYAISDACQALSPSLAKATGP